MTVFHNVNLHSSLTIYCVLGRPFNCRNLSRLKGSSSGAAVLALCCATGFGNSLVQPRVDPGLSPSQYWSSLGPLYHSVHFNYVTASSMVSSIYLESFWVHQADFRMLCGPTLVGHPLRQTSLAKRGSGRVWGFVVLFSFCHWEHTVLVTPYRWLPWSAIYWLLEFGETTLHLYSVQQGSCSSDYWCQWTSLWDPIKPGASEPLRWRFFHMGMQSWNESALHGEKRSFLLGNLLNFFMST